MSMLSTILQLQESQKKMVDALVIARDTFRMRRDMMIEKGDFGKAKVENDLYEIMKKACDDEA